MANDVTSVTTVTEIARRVREHPVSAIASGTLLGHAAIVLATPMLTRLYAPDAWGVLGLYTAIVGVGSTVVGLRLEQAIVNTRSVSEARTLFTVSVVAAILVSALLLGGGLVAFKFSVFPTSFVGPGQLPFAALAMVAVHCFNALRMCMIREQQYGVTGRAILRQNLARAVLPFALFGLPAPWMGLIGGDLLGRFAGIWGLARYYTGRFGRINLRIRRHVLAAVWRRNRIFVLAGVPSSLLNSLAGNIGIPLTAVLFGAVEAGYYVVVYRILQTPMVLLGGAIADFIHGKTAMYTRFRPDELSKFFLRATAKLALVSLTCAAAFLLLGSNRVTDILGPDWRPAAALMRVLLPASVAAFIVSPLARIVLVLRGQRVKLIYDAMSLILLLLSFGIGARSSWPLLETMVLVSASQVTSYVTYWLILLYLVRRVRT